jgi:hypothetical protein
MKPNRKTGTGRVAPWIYATLMLALLGRPLLAADTECTGDCTIRINGLSGKVEQRFDVARPGKRVTAIVCPADLIDFQYTVEKTEEQLQENFSIVGVQPEFKPTGGSQMVPLSQTSLKATGAKDAGPDWDSLQEFWAIRTDLDKARKAVNALNGEVSGVASSLFAGNPSGCDQWPSNLQNQVTTFPANYNVSETPQLSEKRRVAALDKMDQYSS